jgi:acetolactate synthase-1/2/3 large subunit
VLRALEAEGAEVVFGIPGGAILPVYDALARGTTLRHVLARHEQGAGHMAQGYARVDGRPGVVFATSGPGATNLVTPIADAAMDSTPLVCVTGQVRTTLIGTQAFQECDIVRVVSPLVKSAVQVRDPARVAPAIAAAYRLAASGRPGPVLVDVPRDVQEQEAPLELAPADAAKWRPEPDARGVAAAARALAAAARPVLYVGGGAVVAGVSDALVALAEALGAPIVTTLMGKGAFPESHALFAGHPGMHGAKGANLTLNGADVIVALGARFDDRVTGRLDAFAPAAAVVHLDVDPREPSKIRRADHALVGDLGDTLPALLGAVRPLAAPARARRWRAQVAAWQEAHPYRTGDDRDGALAPDRVLERLQARLAGRDAVVTTGVGQHQMWAMQRLRCERPRRFVTSGGLATMGFGLPAAIGAQVARPDLPVVCVDGDGSFQMTSQELATAVQERLPLTVLVLDNGTLGMVDQWQDRFFGARRSHVDLRGAPVDYVALARAYGADAHAVETPAELEAAFDVALAATGPTLIAARVDPRAHVFPMIQPGDAAVDCIEE